MPVDPALHALYAATDFVVFDESGDWVIKVGRPSAAVDALLDRFGVASASVVSAWNPRSVLLPPAENAARHRALLDLLRLRDLRYLLGEGRDTTGDWIPEAECIVFGTSLAEGLELARRFDQNAIVFLERGRAPSLAYVD